MRRRAAVGVDDDLAAGEAAVALRAADLEAAGRVDEVLDLALHHVLRQHRLDDLLDHRFLDLSSCSILGRVLRREHHGSIDSGLPFT